MALLDQPQVTERQLNERITQLKQVLEDELSTTVVYQVPKEKVAYLHPDLFGLEVSNRFHSASYDVEQAGKCFAFGRDTVVFQEHSPRVF